MLVQPISTTNYTNKVLAKKEPSFKMREIYYMHPKDEIINETVNKFKNSLKDYGQIEDITNHILTKYFGWYSPTKLNNPNEMKDTFLLGVITCGMSNLMTALKKDNDRDDARELAAIVYDRIMGSR